MPEEAEKGTEGVSNGKAAASSTEEKAQDHVERAEYDKVAKRAELYDKLAEEAEEYGFETVEEMQDALKMIAGKEDADKGGEEKKVETKPEAKVESKPEVDPRVERAESQSAAAYYEAAWMGYQMEQSGLEKDNQDGFSRAELMKLIRNPAKNQMLADLSQDHEGNIFKAAAEYKRIKIPPEKLRKEGADAAKAEKEAENLADSKTGGKDTTDTSKTDNEKFADEIAPDTIGAYQMPD